MQAVFALVHLQSTLQVNNQHRGYSVLVESRDLIIPNAQQLESPGFPRLFPIPLEVLSTQLVNDQLATLSILLRWYPVKVPLHP